MKTTLLLAASLALLATTFNPAQAQFGGQVYEAVDPCRIVDTRKTADGFIPANQSRNFRVHGNAETLAAQGVTGACANPRSGEEPVAIAAYIVATPGDTNPTNNGVVTAYPADNDEPEKGTAATVNFDQGATIGNTSIISLCTNCDEPMAVLVRETDYHVVIDVQGYFYGATQRFADNGDGTISDHETGLMWEKKDAIDDLKDPDNNPSDADNRYQWSKDKSLVANGTVITNFIDRLNGRVHTAEPLAQYTDWRLPTLSELKTITEANCGEAPCVIDPIFEPTSADFAYWTATRTSDESFSTSVSFLDGTFPSYDKVASLHARAVRRFRD